MSLATEKRKEGRRDTLTTRSKTQFSVPVLGEAGPGQRVSGLDPGLHLMCFSPGCLHMGGMTHRGAEEPPKEGGHRSAGAGFTPYLTAPQGSTQGGCLGTAVASPYMGRHDLIYWVGEASHAPEGRLDLSQQEPTAAITSPKQSERVLHTHFPGGFPGPFRAGSP